MTFDSIMRRKNVLMSDSDEVHAAIRSMERHPDVQSGLRVFLMDAKTTLSCYCVILEQALLKFAFNSAIMTVLSRDQVSADLLSSAENEALFIIFPDETSTYSPLVSSVVKVIYESLIREARRLPGRTLQRRVHFMLDEFAQMPLADFPAAISAARSRNVMFTLVIQAMSQMVDKFGQASAETILNNCAVWIYLGGSDLDIVNRISELGGIEKERILRLDRKSGEAVVRIANKETFISRLVDISRYELAEVPPLCLPL